VRQFITITILDLDSDTPLQSKQESIQPVSFVKIFGVTMKQGPTIKETSRKQGRESSQGDTCLGKTARSKIVEHTPAVFCGSNSSLELCVTHLVPWRFWESIINARGSLGSCSTCNIRTISEPWG